MLNFMLEDSNFYFITALTIVFILSMIEIAFGLMGISILGLFIDQDLELPEIELDHPGTFSRILLWFQFKKVPALVVLMLFLSFFGVIGLTLQMVVLNYYGTFIQNWIACSIALLLTLPFLYSSNAILAKYLFRTDSSIVSRDAFLGATAKIILGTAKRGFPAQGKLTDPFGKVHYLMIEPYETAQEFNTGDLVQIIDRDEIKFYGITKK